jgi:opacity protein-like surface antigen
MYKVVMAGILLVATSSGIVSGAVVQNKKAVKACILPKIPCKKAAPVRIPFCLPWGGWYCGGGLSWITFTSDYNDAMAEEGHHVNVQTVHHSGAGFDCFGGYGLYPFKNNTYCGLELRAAFSTTHGELHTIISHDTYLMQKVKVPFSVELATRVGYRIRDDSMVYARVGLAFLRFSNEQTVEERDIAEKDKSDDHTGFVAAGRFGLGLETMLVDKHIIRLEVKCTISKSQEVKDVKNDADNRKIFGGKLQFRFADVNIQYVVPI